MNGISIDTPAPGGITMATPTRPAPLKLESDWWQQPLSIQKAQVLRDATGFVLQDAIRFYDASRAAVADMNSLRKSGEATTENINALRQELTRTAEALAKAKEDFKLECRTSQSTLLEEVQDRVHSSEIKLSTKYDLIKSDVVHFREENDNLRTSVAVLTESLDTMKREYSGLLEMVKETQDAIKTLKETRHGPREPPQSLAQSSKIWQNLPFWRHSLSLTIADSLQEVVMTAPSTSIPEYVGFRQPQGEPRSAQVNNWPRILPAAQSQVITAANTRAWGPYYSILTECLRDAERVYTRRPPSKDDTKFIWAFMHNLKNEELSRRIQVALLNTLTRDNVTMAHRCKTVHNKMVSLTARLTWIEFRETLENMNLMSEN
jgi:hypothetical protein